MGKRKKLDNPTTDSSKRAKRTKRIEDQLPDMSHFTPEMRKYVIDSHLHISRFTRRAKDDLMRSFKGAEVLHKILKKPRLCHLKYVRDFSSPELDAPELVQSALLKHVENKKQFKDNRNTVFGHLWGEITEFLDERTAESWANAFPGLVPRV